MTDPFTPDIQRDKQDTEKQEGDKQDQKTGEQSEAPQRRLRSQPVADIPLKRRTWLWDQRVPLGELTLWVGHAGIGKSQAAVWLAAEITRGQLLGELHGTPSNVLYLGTEDSWNYTLAPRFIAAGADLSRVYRLYVETVHGDETVMSLALDLDMLREEIQATGARVVVLDALLSTMTGRDLVKQGVVREYLEPVTRLAQDLDIAVIGVAHFRKAGGADPLHLISGSAEFGQVVRSAIGFAADKDAEDGSAVLSLIKTNIAAKGTASMRYRVDPATVDTPDGPTDVGAFVPLGETEDHIRDLIDQDGTGDAEDADDVRGWLHAYLAQEGGAASPEDIMAAGRKAGYSPDQLKRAKKPKGGYPKVHSRKAGMDGGWVWSLEKDDTTLGDEGRAPALETPEGSTKGAKGAGHNAPRPSHSSVLPSGDTATAHPSEGPPSGPQLSVVDGSHGDGITTCRDCGRNYSNGIPTHRDGRCVECDRKARTPA